MDLHAAKEELVTANRILAHENVLDSFGHVSIRHPDDPGQFLLSRARAPGLIEAGDIMTFTLEGAIVGAEPGKPYSERFIHATIYEARPEVMSVVHNHSHAVIPFGVSDVPIKPVFHVAGRIGGEIPIWDIGEKFGDTNLLVTNMEQGRDLASTLGDSAVALMRGHGCAVSGPSIIEAVLTAVYLHRTV